MPRLAKNAWGVLNRRPKEGLSHWPRETSHAKSVLHVVVEVWSPQGLQPKSMPAWHRGWLSHANMGAFGLFLCRVEYDAYVAVERKVPLGCRHNLVESHRIQAVFIRVHQIKGIVKLDYGPDLA